MGFWLWIACGVCAHLLGTSLTVAFILYNVKEKDKEQAKEGSFGLLAMCFLFWPFIAVIIILAVLVEFWLWFFRKVQK